jgi:hypothetical protein
MLDIDCLWIGCLLGYLLKERKNLILDIKLCIRDEDLDRIAHNFNAMLIKY